MKGPGQEGKDQPAEPGGHALDRLRQFEAERGVPPSVKPGNEDADPSRPATKEEPKKARGE